MFIVVSSLLDAWLTLVHLQQGGQEVNPVMALALGYGDSVFVGIKMALSGAGAWWLAAHQQFPLAMRGLYGVVLAYVLLLCYHGMLVFL